MFLSTTDPVPQHDRPDSTAQPTAFLSTTARVDAVDSNDAAESCVVGRVESHRSRRYAGDVRPLAETLLLAE